MFCFCLFYVCLLVFVCLIICFLVCLNHLIGELFFITFRFTIIAGMVRQYKSMQNMSHDWETVKTVSRETVCHRT